LRVFHLVAPAAVGGLEAVVQALALAQKKKGYDVRVIALLETGVLEPAFLVRLRSGGVAVQAITAPARAFRHQRSALRVMLADICPDVLHSHGYLPDVLSASLGTRFPGARVTTVHGFTGGGWRNRFYELLQRLSHSRLDAVVTVSRKLASQLGSFRPRARSIEYLQNSWAPTENLLTRETAQAAVSLSATAFNIGWVGRLSSEKGLDVLIEALPALADLRFHLTVFGDGPERGVLERRAVALGLTDRISWRGVVSDAPRLMPAFDVFVLSSRTEGTPISLLEAIHAGVPIVATVVGGVPDVVSAKEAVLVESETPPALADALRRVHDDRAAAATRAASATKRLETDFAIAPWVDAYEKIYERAISARRPG
jgi:glycosyltransferase involved in cell wall biosynthesis